MTTDIKHKPQKWNEGHIWFQKFDYTKYTYAFFIVNSSVFCEKLVVTFACTPIFSNSNINEALEAGTIRMEKDM